MNAGSRIPAARPGLLVETGRPGAVGGGFDHVRKRRLKYLLAGGGIAAVLAAVLISWGLSGHGDLAAQTSSGKVAGVAAASPSDVALPAPTASSRSGGSATLPGGSPGVTERPALGVTGPAASTTPRAVAPATSAPNSPHPSDSPASAAPSDPDGTRLTSAGGVVYAVCGGARAKLTSWQPAPGYTVQKVNQGPAIAPEVVFAGASARYRMTVTCVGGTPTPLVLPL